jgi:hypothetical protein
MSSRKAILLWVSVNVKAKRSIRFALPVPLFILLLISDILEDSAFFIPAIKNTKNGGKLSPASAKQLVIASAGFLREIALKTEPFDLADIDITDGDKRVIVKCLLK